MVVIAIFISFFYSSLLTLIKQICYWPLIGDEFDQQINQQQQQQTAGYKYKYKYNLRIKMLKNQNKIHHQSQIFNKQNRMRQTNSKHRNDHSIQAKSPLKIPSSTFSKFGKTDLTFRIKNQKQISNLLDQSSNVALNISKQSQAIEHQSAGLNHVQTNNKQRQIFRINIAGLTNALQLPVPVGKNILISEAECVLIDKMWEICTKITTYQNQYIKAHLNIIQLQIKKMLTMIAQQNLEGEAPLASSKKIKLQNCIANSHCQKQADQKQFESDEQSQKLTHQFSSSLQFSQKTMKSQNLQQYKNESQKRNESTDELEMKKIMYMLEQKNNQNSKKTSNKNSRINAQNERFFHAKSQRLSQLSSFNQNYSDDSGFTLFQIDRCTQRICSPEITSKSMASVIINEIENEKIRFKKCELKTNRNETRQTKVDTQTYQSGSESEFNSSQNMDNNQNGSMGNKRKVLNDIVAMLNHKYNKNIRLD